MDKFVEVAPYYNITKVNYLPAVLLMSKQSWDKLPEDLQQIVQEAAIEAAEYEREVYVSHYTRSLNEAKGLGS